MLSIILNSAQLILCLLTLNPLQRFVQLDSSLFYGYKTIEIISQVNENFAKAQEWLNLALLTSFCIGVFTLLLDTGIRKTWWIWMKYENDRAQQVYFCMFLFTICQFINLSLISIIARKSFIQYSEFLNNLVDNPEAVTTINHPMWLSALGYMLVIAHATNLLFLSRRKCI